MLGRPRVYCLEPNGCVFSFFAYFLLSKLIFILL